MGKTHRGNCEVESGELKKCIGCGKGKAAEEFGERKRKKRQG